MQQMKYNMLIRGVPFGSLKSLFVFKPTAFKCSHIFISCFFPEETEGLFEKTKKQELKCTVSLVVTATDLWECWK